MPLHNPSSSLVWLPIAIQNTGLVYSPYTNGSDIIITKASLSMPASANMAYLNVIVDLNTVSAPTVGRIYINVSSGDSSSSRSGGYVETAFELTTADRFAEAAFNLFIPIDSGGVDIAADYSTAQIMTGAVWTVTVYPLAWSY